MSSRPRRSSPLAKGDDPLDQSHHWPRFGRRGRKVKKRAKSGALGSLFGLWRFAARRPLFRARNSRNAFIRARRTLRALCVVESRIADSELHLTLIASHAPVISKYESRINDFEL